jgi:hypothetical protein
LILALGFRAGGPPRVPSLASGTDPEIRVVDGVGTATVPAYARLDLRIERRFAVWNHAGLLYAELLNVLDRENRAATTPLIWPGPVRAGVATERLYPRLVMVGFRLEF